MALVVVIIPTRTYIITACTNKQLLASYNHDLIIVF